MIEFITNNSIWFIVGGVLIVLVIIGYIVDIKMFGVKKVEEEPKEEEKKEEVKEEKTKKKSKKESIDMDIPFIAEADEIKEEPKEKVEEPKEEDLNAPFGDTLTSDLDEYASSPVENENSTLNEYTSNEDLNVPFGDPVAENNEANEEKKEQSVEKVEEQPVETNEKVEEPQPVEDFVQPENIELQGDIELPVTDEPIQESRFDEPEEEKKDDIWNF